MGNEASSVRIHRALTAEDLKGLRQSFPGGGSGPNPKNLDFGCWAQGWSPGDRTKMETIMKEREAKASSAGAAQQQQLGQGEGISFYAYQDLAGSVVRGPTESRVKLLFRLLDRSPDKAVRSEELIGLAGKICDVAARLIDGKCGNAKDESISESSLSLATGLAHELVFPGEAAKESFGKDPPSDLYLDFDSVERWMVMKCPLFEQVLLFALATSFGLPVADASAGVRASPLVPSFGVDWSKTRLRPQDVIFLNSQIPTELRLKWRPLFDSSSQGENFSRLAAAAQNRGPTFVVLWEKGSDRVFGGFNADSWKVGPKFATNAGCFLFHLRPKCQSYETSRFNSNYAYFNLKQKTLPNGLGFGGQLPDYFGLWLPAEEYGKGKCAPTCSSFGSPQLSQEKEFQYQHLELWGVGEEPDTDEDGEARSALDLDPEAQAVMEMMGKTFVSKDVRAADEQMEKDKESLQ